MTLIFDKLAPHLNICSKDDLNYFLVNSNAKNSLRRAKNVLFFLFCILVDSSMGGGYSPSPRPPTWLRYCPRHIRKGVSIRRNIASDQCTAVGCHQFRKESKKHQRIIMFKRNYSFFHHCLLPCRFRCFNSSIFSKLK